MADHILTQIPSMSIQMCHFPVLQCVLSALLCICAHDARTADAAPGYVQDAASTFVRGGFGTCWHAGTWSMAGAVIGCDGVLQAPVAKITAPPLMELVTPEKQPAPVPPPQRCDYSLTLAGDDTFDFDDTSLKQKAMMHIDAQLIEPLSVCTTERIVIVGHADRLGTAPSNQRLSEKRASTVAAYLSRRGVGGKFEVKGDGSTEALTNCEGKMNVPARIVCLAPNRRVVIQTFGNRGEVHAK